VPGPTPIPVYKLILPKPETSASNSPHTGLALSLTSDACAACHSTHAAASPNLTNAPPPMSNQCFQCHDGSHASSNVKAEFTATGVKANDPSTDSYYQHPATVVDSHTSGQDNEFGGVSNRHSSCADCHQPHRADGTGPTETTGGWGASGAIVGASGVIVTNAPSASPTYAFNPTGVTFEYQLCLKCHSGFTVLPSNTGKPPSQWTLDKGAEIDPLNAKSFHPIEAAGTNQTAAMAASLVGTSPYKLWNFAIGDTIRCTSCHAGPTTPANGTTADANLAPHASVSRGILIANYRDRQLKAPTESYDAADFALCYACHAEAPFVDASTAASLGATNFAGTPDAKYGGTFQSLHALHLTQIAPQPSGGPSTDIDTAGAGQGDAICAECHFRLHSTALAYDKGDQSNTRLVNFAPDVTPAVVNGQSVLQWVAPTASTPGSCTLTCHGYAHVNVTYGP
jgi:predicted CXXCH cytochrome family protein